jgi:hypothetical protein
LLRMDTKLSIVPQVRLFCKGTVTVGSLDRRQMVGRGLRLELFTIVYNCLEALVGVVAGLLAGSIALAQVRHGNDRN